MKVKMLIHEYDLPKPDPELVYETLWQAVCALAAYGVHVSILEEGSDTWKTFGWQ